MKKFYVLLAILMPLFCSAQKELLFNVDQEKFDALAEQFIIQQTGKNEKVVVLFREGCQNDIYYFIFKSYNEYPDWLERYLQSNTKFLAAGKYKVPIVTDLDYALHYNKEQSRLPKEGVVVSKGYTFLDGSILGRKNRFVIALENDQGRFGKIVPQDELMEP